MRFQPCSHLEQGTEQDEPGRELLMGPKVAQPTQLLMPRARTSIPSPNAKAGTRQWNSLGAFPPTPPRGFGSDLLPHLSADPSLHTWRGWQPVPLPDGKSSSPGEGPSWHESLGHFFVHDIPTCLSAGQLKKQQSVGTNQKCPNEPLQRTLGLDLLSEQQRYHSKVQMINLAS